jgi:hypothetical protein
MERKRKKLMGGRVMPVLHFDLMASLKAGEMKGGRRNGRRPQLNVMQGRNWR